ncbi:MAG: Carboxypeptidase regulatory-like domain, partial [Acidobacteriota bacterium]|nr:Carboxypeptidase regulatory-like domain [Acidobacteriota bacterium]
MPTRFPIIVLSILVLSGGAAAGVAGADRRLAGTVVDQSGRAVPRAYVRLLDASGTRERGTFADETGRFDLAATDGAACRVEATLPGFQPAIVPCPPAAAGTPLRIVLAVAPIEETMIVTATRTEAPTSQV